MYLSTWDAARWSPTAGCWHVHHTRQRAVSVGSCVWRMHGQWRSGLVVHVVLTQQLLTSTCESQCTVHLSPDTSACTQVNTLLSTSRQKINTKPISHEMLLIINIEVDLHLDVHFSKNKNKCNLVFQNSNVCKILFAELECNSSVTGIKRF